MSESLNVFDDLKLRECQVTNLYIFKNKAQNTKKYKCKWLPKVDRDIRPNLGRSPSGKRLPYMASTGETDPLRAGKQAIIWYEGLIEKIENIRKEQKYNAQYNLHHYWEIWYSRFCKDLTLSEKNKSDRLNDWKGEGFGIAHQKWSLKSIDQITRGDIADYFSDIESRSRKCQQKSILNKLNDVAKDDFKDLRPFEFPIIKGKSSNKQVEHFSRDEWDRLLRKIIELSGNFANKLLSVDEYQELDKEHRKWIDLYDSISLLFFFYLRAEDIPRIRTEWFKDVGGVITVKLEKTKQDRLKQETEHYYPDGYKVWKRIEKRRPDGFLCFPHLDRTKKRVNKNISETANALLQEVVELCNISKKEKMTLTNIRHTAFRLTLEESKMVSFDEQELRLFADNGNTSIEMLNKTYLKYIRRGTLASKAREVLPSSSWAMQKKVSL